MGSLTDYPWFFRKIIRPLGLPTLQALGPLPWLATSEADSRKAAQPQATSPPQDNRRVANSRKPASKGAGSKKSAETTTTQATPT